MTRLPKLDTLSLASIPITNAGLPHLKCLKHLRGLSIVGTTLTDGAINKLQQTLPKCSIKSNTQFPDLAREERKSIAELKRLNVRLREENGEVVSVGIGRDVNFSDNEMKHLQWLLDLKELNLAGSRITDTGMQQLKGIMGFEVLDLGNTKVGDAWSDSLSDLSELNWLDLRGTRSHRCGTQAAGRRPQPEKPVSGQHQGDERRLGSSDPPDAFGNVESHVVPRRIELRPRRSARTEKPQASRPARHQRDRRRGQGIAPVPAESRNSHGLSGRGIAVRTRSSCSRRSTRSLLFSIRSPRTTRTSRETAA